MAAKKRLRVPRALLICCEGKTEKEYFNILLDFFRPPAYVRVEVYGQKGQHMALIDNTVALRKELCEGEDAFSEGDVECWAVCDEDKMPCSYAELERYADRHRVHLAFSAPQFEMYLPQHFEQSGETDTSIVFQKLSEQRMKHGAEGDYDDDTKADLGWLRDAIDSKPKIVKTAITNSDIRNHATKRPFLTVQALTRRINDLSI